MAMAFSAIHSGAAPATGISSMDSPTPPSFTTLHRAISIRLLSTQEPTWSTGGMPTASHTSRRPLPAYRSAPSGASRPTSPQTSADRPAWEVVRGVGGEAGDQVGCLLLARDHH